MAEQVLLLNAQINSFEGISSDDPIIFDFTQANKKGKNITKLEGDQGTRKTSSIEALIYLLRGLVPNQVFERLLNTADGTMNLDGEFMVGDRRYRVHATKTKFELERYLGQIPRKGKMVDDWKSEPEPKTTLRDLIGPLGVSPMPLRGMEGDKQIDWFRKTFAGSNTEELEQQEAKLRGSLKVATKSRTDANRDYTRLSAALANNPYYVDRAKWDSQFRDKPRPTTDSAKVEMEVAQGKVSQYNQYKAGIDRANEMISDIDAKILELQNQKAGIIERKAVGEKWLSENDQEKLVAAYNEKIEAFSNVSELMVKYNDYRLMITQEEEMNEFETIVQQFDAQKDVLRGSLLEMTKKYVPEIPGLEIKVADGLDEKEEGIYYNGRNIGTLSESELWQLFFVIWMEKEVPFVFVENINTLGSKAIEILNAMAANGVKVFASLMNRNIENKFKVAFVDEIKK